MDLILFIYPTFFRKVMYPPDPPLPMPLIELPRRVTHNSMYIYEAICHERNEG